MAAITKRKTKLHIQLTNSNQATAHGGQVLVDALCRRFGLWKRIHEEPSLDPRKRTGAGFSPVANLAQLLFTLTSGGASLADAERLAQDRVLMQLLGLDKGADQTTLGEWLRSQTKESVLTLHRINADLVDWASQQAKPGRWLHGGEVELFFDDTQIEVEGHKFEGARINYEGNRALGWQTLWYGPWLLDGILDGAGDVSEHLPVLLDEHQHRWQGRASYLYADSGSSAGKYLNRIERADFTRWSISYNKWTDKLDRLASQLPERQWSALPSADQPQEQYAWVKHQPGECQQAQKFATVRWKQDGDLMWRYAYRVCQAGDQDSPQAVFERHRLKGAKEQGFSEVLSGLDLHHPPCKDLMANQAFYAIAMLAYNILTSLKVLDLPDDAQGWRIRTIIRYLLTVPVSVSTHARYDVARICIPAGWLRWWRLFVDQWVPKRKPGRPVTEAVDSA
jgi:Transposase DDE domain group 1